MKNFIQKHAHEILIYGLVVILLSAVYVLNSHKNTKNDEILGTVSTALKINQILDPIGAGFIYSNGTGTSTLIASSTISVNKGGTGISTNPTYGQLLVGNAGGGYTLTATSSLGITSGASSISSTDKWATSTDTTSIYTNSATKVGIGTSSPYAALSVVGSSGVVASKFTATSTSATSTVTNFLASGTADLTNSLIGVLNFETDGGIYTWTDMPQVSAVNGTVQSYTAKLGGNSMLTIYGKANGSGGVTNLAVGIGTTTPFQTLSVVGTATTTISHGSTTHPSCDQYYSPNGTAYRTYMSNAGSLTTEAGYCQ